MSCTSPFLSVRKLIKNELLLRPILLHRPLAFPVVIGAHPSPFRCTLKLLYCSETHCGDRERGPLPSFPYSEWNVCKEPYERLCASFRILNEKYVYHSVVTCGNKCRVKTSSNVISVGMMNCSNSGDRFLAFCRRAPHMPTRFESWIKLKLT